MAKNNKHHDKSFVTLDPKVLPIVGLFGKSPEMTYPQEYAIVNSLKVNQSATFPTKKLNVIQSIRTRIVKQSGKKFIVKKVTVDSSRIWRLPDNYVLRHGGYTHGKRKLTANQEPKQ